MLASLDRSSISFGFTPFHPSSIWQAEACLGKLILFRVCRTDFLYPMVPQRPKKEKKGGSKEFINPSGLIILTSMCLFQMYQVKTLKEEER
jgi:hypothetical protein